MLPAPVLDRPPASPWPRRRRWALVVVVSLVVHLTVLDAVPRWTVEAGDEHGAPIPLRATLMPAVRPEAAPEAAPAPAAVATPAPVRRRAARPTRPTAPTAVATAIAPDVFVPESTEPVPQVAVDPPPRKTVDAPTASPTPVVASPPPAPPVSPPRSARLDYRVLSQKATESNPIYGIGTIDWRGDDGRYAIDLHADAKILFFNVGVLTSHSEGTIGPSGLAPDRYTEKPLRRATVATNFNRDDRQSVTFSSTAGSTPLVPGTQDRLSILFQVGGLLLGDPSKAATGLRIDVPVAGVRGDVETWSFESLGKETVATGGGDLATTHLRRTPRPDSNDRTIEVWVADEGGYPARVVYTEPNGNTVSMTLDRIFSTVSAVEPPPVRPPAPG